MWQRSDGWMTSPDVLNHLGERAAAGSCLFELSREEVARFFSLKRKVNTLKALNMIPAETSVSELKVMVIW